VSGRAAAVWIAVAAGAFGAGAVHGPAWAGNEADVQRMIDALKPGAAAVAPAAGRTRTLVVEPVPASPAPQPAATPSPAPSPASPTPSAQPAQPAPATAGAPAAPPPPGGGLSLAIVFEPNTAQLRPESGEMIGMLVAAMLSRELRQTRFLIEGHTEARGTPAQNLRLSRERAEQVRLALVTLGVPGERLSAAGKGSSEPVNARDPRAPENRRVRVVPLP
jgi:outer membrane protein OmpA-like peptidoglycan-associated protein